MIYFTSNIFRGVAQFGRVLGSGPRGRRFKSSHSDHESLANTALARLYIFVLFVIVTKNSTIIQLLIKKESKTFNLCLAFLFSLK